MSSVPCSGGDANANLNTCIACNRMVRCRGGAKSWPYRPKGLLGWGPGIASRAGGAGLTGRNRRGRVLNEELRVCARFAATGAHRPLVRSGSLMPPGSFHGSRSLPFPILACLRSSCVCQRYVFAGPSTCLGVLRFPPDCGSGPVGLPACKASSISLA